MKRKYIHYLKGEIKLQKDAISYYKVSSICIFLIGAVIISLSLIFFNEATVGPLIGIGGAVVTSFCSIPYKEITPRRERINSLEFFKKHFEQYENLPPDDQKILVERTDGYILQNMRRT